MMTHRTVVWGVLLACVVAGCSRGGPESSTSGLQSGDGYTVRGALEELPPAGRDRTLVYTADLRAATEAAGLDVPSDGSAEEVGRWLSAVTGVPPEEPAGPPVFVALPELFHGSWLGPDEFADLVGWSVLDVGAFVEHSVPPNVLTIVAGDFDETTLSADLVEVDDGIVTDIEGEDHMTNFGADALSRIGAPSRLAQEGNRIAVGQVTGQVRYWLEGKGDTLADDETFAAVASALDAVDVYSAVLASIEGGGLAAGSLGPQVTPEQLEELLAQYDEVLPEAPYDAVGIGWSVVDGEARVAAAYHFGVDEAAAASADRLESLYRDGVSVLAAQPFSTWVTVEDVSASGDVVTVTVTPTEPAAIGFLVRALTNRDVLFLSR